MPSVTVLLSLLATLVVLQPTGSSPGGLPEANAEGDAGSATGPAPSPAEARAYVIEARSLTEPIFIPPEQDAPEVDCEVSLAAGADPAEQRACIAALLASNTPEWDWRLRDAITWALREGDDELAWRAQQRFRPVARCSMDFGPQRHAAIMADFCRRTGRSGCAVRLLTTTLMHGHARRSDVWVDGRPLSYDSPIDALAELVDVSVYLPGLLVDPEGNEDDAPTIHPHFIALAVANNPAKDAVMRTLEAWIGDHALSPGVRRSALYAWGQTLIEEGEAFSTVRRRASALPGVDADLLEAVFADQ